VQCAFLPLVPTDLLGEAWESSTAQ